MALKMSSTRWSTSHCWPTMSKWEPSSVVRARRRRSLTRICIFSRTWLCTSVQRSKPCSFPVSCNARVKSWSWPGRRNAAACVAICMMAWVPPWPACPSASMPPVPWSPSNRRKRWPCCRRSRHRCVAPFPTSVAWCMPCAPRCLMSLASFQLFEIIPSQASRAAACI